MAYKEAIKEQLYLKAIFSLIPVLNSCYSNKVYTDSVSAMDLAKNPEYHTRTKHIDIQYHFIREAITRGDTSLIYTPTESQIADGFTKALGSPKWETLLENLKLKE